MIINESLEGKPYTEHILVFPHKFERYNDLLESGVCVWRRGFMVNFDTIYHVKKSTKSMDG